MENEIILLSRIKHTFIKSLQKFLRSNVTAPCERVSLFQAKIVIVLPMDPPCLHISVSQPCPGTLCGSLRRKVTPPICSRAIRLQTEPWTSSCRAAAGFRERQTHREKYERELAGKLQSKSWATYIMPPWIINIQINLFNVREKRADDRGMCGVGGPSPYLWQTHNSLSPERRGPPSHTLPYSSLLFLLSVSWFTLQCTSDCMHVAHQQRLFILSAENGQKYVDTWTENTNVWTCHPHVGASETRMSLSHPPDGCKAEAESRWAAETVQRPRPAPPHPIR